MTTECHNSNQRAKTTFANKKIVKCLIKRIFTRTNMLPSNIYVKSRIGTIILNPPAVPTPR